jgi:uncharacterized protein YutE (UPF0331/DUF86 family)
LERLKERLAESLRALATLDEAVAIASPSTMERDAALIRFAYTFESIWKTAQLYLAEIENIDTGTQRAAIRACGAANLLTAEQTRDVLNMARDRNLVVHTYREPLAALIYARLKQHAALLRVWLDAIDKAVRAA